ncbi:MAG: hypothetical protein WCV70_02100 [Patescibacteria group bacterium]|jgi:hypothetical protein
MERKNKKLNLAFFALLIVLALVFVIAKNKQSDFNSAISSKFTEQKLSFSYFAKNGKSDFKLILGDLNGLNFNTYKVLNGVVGKTFNGNNSVIIVPSIFKEKSSVKAGEVNQEVFMNAISNNNGVVIVDNFCTSNWQNPSPGPYDYTPLSKGKFCQSEEETRDIQKIISGYAIKEVVIVYDTDSYVSFIDNFLLFLKENGINYKLVKIENEQQIIKEF